MDVIQIEIWLKNTILGLVVLGAVGSLVAVLAIRVLTPLFRLIQRRVLLAHYNLHIKANARENFILGYLSGRDDPSRVAIYLLYHILVFVFLIVTAGVSITILSIRLSLPTQIYVSVVNIGLIIIFLLCIYRILFMLWIYRTTYFVHVYPCTSEEDTEAKKGTRASPEANSPTTAEKPEA